MFLIKLVTLLENRERLESLVQNPRISSVKVFFGVVLKAQHRTEASSLTPVGQTTSLDVASLFLFSSLDILVRLISKTVVRNLHHPKPPLALNSERGFLKKLCSYFKAHLILWSDATLSLIVC